MPADAYLPPAEAAALVERLALGTAQFGLAYGINNVAGRPADATVQEILATAQAAGIALLDTAAGYGDSEARLGNWLAQQPHPPFQLVTKLAAAPVAEVREQLRQSLARLRQPAVYGVLFHSFGAFREHPAAWAVLQEARAAGVAQRVGVSLYHPREAEWLLEQAIGVDLVQVPFNVLDQRFAAVLPRLRQAGVEVHVRSAFLQGLLLRPTESLPDFFAPLAPKIAQLRALAGQAGVPLAALLLLFAAFAEGVDRVVIGVDTSANLHENLAAARYLAQAEALRPALQELAETTDNYTLPYAWPPRS